MQSEFNNRLIGTEGATEIDVFNFCEMTNNTFKDAHTYGNIVNMYSSCSFWANEGGNVYADESRLTDITNLGDA